MLNDVLLILRFAALAFVLPVVVGPVILLSHRDDALARLAGVFTLKPLAATPLWALIVTLRPDIFSSAQQTTSLLLTLVPGIGLTLLIVWAFRQVYKLEPIRACVLLGADVIRWLSTFVMVLMGPTLFFVVPLIIPSAYAILAAVIVSARSGRVGVSA